MKHICNSVASYGVSKTSSLSVATHPPSLKLRRVLPESSSPQQAAGYSAKENKMLKWLKKLLVLIYRWLALWLPLFMLDILPIISKWLKNSDQVTIQDLILPAALSLILSAVVAVIFLYFYNKNRFAGLAGAVLAVFILGQEYHSHLFNFLGRLRDAYKNHFVLAFFLATVILTYSISFLIHKLTKKWLSKTDILARAGFIAIAVAFLIQFYPVAKVFVIEWPQFFYRPPALAGQVTTSPSSAKPDIYYIVLDRYTSQNVLKSQFNFDNSDFINFLTDNKFFVNPDALDNYPFTTMSIASTLNADYNSDLVKKFSKDSDQTLEPYHDAVRYASVIKQLKSLGYSYYFLGTWYEATNQAPLADHFYQPEGQLTVFNHTSALSDFSKQALSASIFLNSVNHGLTIGNLKVLTYSGQTPIVATLSKIDILNNIAREPAGGRFVFAHILVPHDPYYFNADGTLAADPGVNNINEPLKQKYLGQVEFINNQMKSIISKIQKNSQGQAIIIIQSDEGPYPMEFNEQQFDMNIVENELRYGDMRQWSNQDLKMKYGILAAYYVPKATNQDLETGGDSVNIFRLVLNTYFGDKLPYLPRCYYVYPKGRDKAFLYTNINNRLTGQTNSACSSDGS